jgi:hypothetical protein
VQKGSGHLYTLYEGGSSSRFRVKRKNLISLTSSLSGFCNLANLVFYSFFAY